MKRIIVLAIASFFALTTYGQQNDTIYYPIDNASGFTLYGYLGGGYIGGPNIDGTGVGQTFETSSGNLTSFIVAIGAIDIIGTADTFVAEVYNVGTNGLPQGGPIATKEFRTDSLVTGATIGDGFNLIEFDSPVAVSGKFAIAFDFDYGSSTYSRDDTIAIISNNDGDGLGLERAISEFQGQWFTTDFAYGGLDIDFLIFPILSGVAPEVFATSKDLTRCSGSTDTVTVTTAGLASPDANLNVQWSPTTGVTQPFQLQTLIQVDAAVDSYTVSVYDPVLDSTFYAGIKYTFNDLELTADQSSPISLVCGGTTTLSATAGGATAGSSFTWDDDNNTPGLNLTVSEAGTYSVVGTNAFGCSAEATFTVELNVNQTANFTIPSELCANENFTLTNTSSATSGWTFTWYANGDTFSNTQDLTTSLAAGSYPVRLEADSAGLCNVTVTKNIGVQVCNNIEEALNGELIEVFPNPSNGAFSLNLRDVNSTDVSVRVTDLNGKVIFRQDEVSGNSIFNLDLSVVSEGVYLLQVTTEESTLINKLQVTK